MAKWWASISLILKCSRFQQNGFNNINRQLGSYLNISDEEFVKNNLIKVDVYLDDLSFEIYEETLAYPVSNPM